MFSRPLHYRLALGLRAPKVLVNRKTSRDRQMRRIPLGSTDVTITDYCLGTMTWGNQTPEDDAHRQMDMALDAGIDIVDTAEMYPVNPVRAETVGLTEEIVGTWNAKNPGRRGDYRLATKITGKNGAFVRMGQDITGATLPRRSTRRLRGCRRNISTSTSCTGPTAAATISARTGPTTRRAGQGGDAGAYARGSGGRRCRAEGWQDRAFRPVERKRLGHRAVAPHRR
jgi:hypothetical protein